MRRLLALALVLGLMIAAPAAAQVDGNPFNDNLPAPTATPTPADDGDTSATTVWLIAGGALVLIVGLGLFITRDARRNLTSADRRAVEREEQGYSGSPDGERLAGGARGRAKSKARKRGKAQRQARKANRPR